MPAHPDPAPSAWDAVVEANPRGSYLQLTAWARVKAVNGWSSRRLLDPAAGVGAQVLLRRPGPLPWAFGYAPRGPVLERWDAASIAGFTELARAGLRDGGRASHLRIDPEIEREAGPDDGDAVDGRLRAAGWLPAPAIQPARTRVIDLRADEAALWGDLRKKWRQYVNKARVGGVVVVDAGPERLDEFYRIYRETADRAGLPDPGPVGLPGCVGRLRARRTRPAAVRRSCPTASRSRRCSSSGLGAASSSRTAA